jgi:serine/threonine protein kinase
LKHPYILKFERAIFGDKYIYMITEKADRNLEEVIMKKKMTPLYKRNTIYRLANALNYIHASGFVHCDLKAINILVQNKHPLIADFGLIRLAENTSEPDRCQTYHYRAPEFIIEASDYIDIFGSHNKWNNNYIGAEIWSFGILCLEIIYKYTNITISDLIVTNPLIKKFGTKIVVDNPYATFINALTEAYRSDTQYSVYNIVVYLFGDVSPENDPLLRLVCDTCLELNQNVRIEKYTLFLTSEVFGINQSSSIVNPYVFPRINDDIYPIMTDQQLESLEILFRRLLAISNEFNYPQIILPNTIDYIIQKFHIFKGLDPEFRLGVFGMAVMYIMQSLFGIEQFAQVDDFKRFALRRYSTYEFLNMVRNILNYEGGIFNFESIYFELPRKRLIERAVTIMLRPQLYIQYKTPSNLARELIQEETPEELEHGRSRDFKSFKFEMPNIRY